jgi:hypothetical protein
VIKVPLKLGWSRNTDWPTMTKWCRDNGIKHNDWRYVPSLDNSKFWATMQFTHAADALAFRLKFGL